MSESFNPFFNSISTEFSLADTSKSAPTSRTRFTNSTSKQPLQASSQSQPDFNLFMNSINSSAFNQNYNSTPPLSFDPFRNSISSSAQYYNSTSFDLSRNSTNSSAFNQCYNSTLPSSFNPLQNSTAASRQFEVANSLPSSSFDPLWNSIPAPRQPAVSKKRKILSSSDFDQYPNPTPHSSFGPLQCSRATPR